MQNQHLTITIDRLPKFLKAFNDQGGAGDIGERALSTFILSSPGFGKTSQVAAFASDIEAELITQVASTLDRLDVAGLPQTVKDATLGNVTEFAPMRLMASLSKERNPDGPKVVLYFNELNAAPESVYPVLYRLFNERSICGLTLRDNVILIADGNPSSSASAGREMQMALRRRFAWLVIQEDIPVWQKWAMAHGVDARVVSFFSAADFAKHFCDFDPKARQRITYSCPASWTKLARKLDVILDTFSSHEERMTAFCGLVGMESGTAFSAYIKHMDDLPDVQSILENPEEAVLPKKADILSLLCGSVINYVVKNAAKDSKLIDKAALLCARLVETKGDEQNQFPEFGAFLFRSLYNSNPKTVGAKLVRSKASDKIIKLVMQDKDMMDALQAAMAATTSAA